MDVKLHVKNLLAEYTEAMQYIESLRLRANEYKAEAVTKRDANILALIPADKHDAYRAFVAACEREQMDIEAEFSDGAESKKERLDEMKQEVKDAMLSAPDGEFQTIKGEAFDAVAKTRRGAFDKELTLKRLKRLQDAYQAIAPEIQTLIDDCLQPDTREVAITPKRAGK